MGAFLETAASRPCSCPGVGPLPRAVTPRETLRGMGAGALRNHLESCGRDQQELQLQATYQQESAKKSNLKLQARLERENSTLQAMNARRAKSRSKSAAQREQMKSEIKKLELTLPDLRTSNMKEYSQWYDHTQKMKGVMAHLSKCTAKQSCMKAAAEVQIDQEARHNLRTPDTYDLIKQVEDCEAANAKSADAISKAQAAANSNVLTGSEKISRLERSMEEQKHFADVLSRAWELPPLRARKRALETQVASLKDSIADYKKRNIQVSAHLQNLVTSMQKCGC